jgi:hypothetical protein
MSIEPAWCQSPRGFLLFWQSYNLKAELFKAGILGNRERRKRVTRPRVGQHKVTLPDLPRIWQYDPKATIKKGIDHGKDKTYRDQN